MEAQVQELIDKIKLEGMAKAQAEAAAIVEAAKQEAEAIRDRSRRELETERAAALAAIAQHEIASRQSLAQAARDCLITLENNIHDILVKLLREQSGAALSPELMAEIIRTVAGAWIQGRERGLAVYLSSHDFNKFGSAIKASLAQTISEGIEVFVSPRFLGGLRIGYKGGAQADFSRETLAEILATRVSAELALLFRTEPEPTDP